MKAVIQFGRPPPTRIGLAAVHCILPLPPGVIFLNCGVNLAGPRDSDEERL